MKRLALLAAAAATAIAVLAVLSTSGSAQSGERTIVVTELSKGSLFKFVDQRPRTKPGRNEPSASLGDQLVFSSPLGDGAHRRAGRLAAACTAIKPGAIERKAVFLCTGVAHLTDGDLFLAARFLPRPSGTVRGALTGGTGAYAGARGTFTSTGEPSTDTFHILP
jgi:hypothetical protein